MLSSIYKFERSLCMLKKLILTQFFPLKRIYWWQTTFLKLLILDWLEKCHQCLLILNMFPHAGESYSIILYIYIYVHLCVYGCFGVGAFILNCVILLRACPCTRAGACLHVNAAACFCTCLGLNPNNLFHFMVFVGILGIEHRKSCCMPNHTLLQLVSMAFFSFLLHCTPLLNIKNK